MNFEQYDRRVVKMALNNGEIIEGFVYDYCSVENNEEKYANISVVNQVNRNRYTVLENEIQSIEKIDGIRLPHHEDRDLYDLDDLIAENNRLIVLYGMPTPPTEQELEEMRIEIARIKAENRKQQ